MADDRRQRSGPTGPADPAGPSGPSDAAELSSLESGLQEVEARVLALARHYEGTDHEALLAALYDAERTLRASIRALQTARRLAR